MKRFLILLTAIVMAMAAMAQSAGIVLSYNKGRELKFFKSYQLHLAIDEAEVNDTIYFGPGSYSLLDLPQYEGSSESSYKQITKPLVFIGVSGSSNGANSTRLTGCERIFLNIDSRIDDSKRVFSFEGLNFEYTPIYTTYTMVIEPATSLKELTIKNSTVSVSDYLLYETGSMIDDLVIDRCYIDDLSLSGRMAKRVSVNNSRIRGNLYGGSNSSFGVATFDHCYIHSVVSSFVGLIQHSLIYQNNAGQEGSFENCCYCREDGSASKDECMKLSESDFLYLDKNPSSYDPCKDGTPYGEEGGLTPYTPYSQYPNADTDVESDTNKNKSFVDYDAINKKLTITVKRLGE